MTTKKRSSEHVMVNAFYSPYSFWKVQCACGWVSPHIWRTEFEVQEAFNLHVAASSGRLDSHSQYKKKELP